MIRRPAGDDHDAAEIFNGLSAEDQIAEIDSAVFDARGNRAAQRLGLLHNFLEHEVRISALLRRRNLPVDMMVLLFNRQLHGVEDLNGVARQNRDLAVFHVRNVSGVFDQRRHVRGDEVAAVTVAQQQRRVFPCRIAPLRIVCADNADGIGALAPVQNHVDGVLHAVDLVEPEAVLEQLRDNLRIGLGRELHALFFEKFANFQIVFNDAVVNQRDLAVLGHMGMGVDIVRLAVGRPAGVPDAGSAVQQRAVFRHRGKIFKPALALCDVQHAVFRHADACGVIAPVLQPRKPLQ